jgi:hypothetical protein
MAGSDDASSIFGLPSTAWKPPPQTHKFEALISFVVDVVEYRLDIEVLST